MACLGPQRKVRGGKREKESTGLEFSLYWGQDWGVLQVHALLMNLKHKSGN